ncbi:MAG: NAD(P)-dependent oxidoreductase [Spirochaetales bacterium]|nr:NAD(P)-dependent oxidoreductase [Spirochaetales bacterium]
MNCFIDPHIKLTAANGERAKALGLNLIPYRASEVDFNSIEYLLFHSPLPDDELRQMKNCRYIGVRAHNTDYINKSLAEAMKIEVKGLNRQHGVTAVAEHSFALIFALAKNIRGAHQNLIEGKWQEGLPQNFQLSGKTLGIIGYGEIGRRVAQMGEALGMKIALAQSPRSLKPGNLSVEEVLVQSDVLSLHLSTSKENRHYLNRERLKLMKKGSILINTARASVVDYEALEEEISLGRFWGVGLDVYDDEPVENSAFKQYSNVILTPHIGYRTGETLENMNGELLENLKDYLNQQKTID